MIPKYPKIIPELEYGGNQQSSMNNESFKKVLLSTFFYKRIDRDNKVFLKKSFSDKLHYMPLFTMTKALAYYNDYIKSGEKKKLINFKQIASNLIKNNDKYGWKHDNLIQLPGYPQKYSSYSCLHNGRGLGVLIRYYQFEQSENLLKRIHNVLNSFTIESDKGGVLRPDGYFLEYSWGNNSPVVWNGFMSALIGLHDCYKYGPGNIKPTVKTIFNQGITTLKNNLDKLIYNGKFIDWIRYDDNKLYFADGPYMDIEINQLRYLNNATKNNIFKRYHKKLIDIQHKNKLKKSFYEYYYFCRKRLMK